ncbi:hypothetical protein V8C86DRAFT_2688688 [Haematococcus lacustris]
MSTHAPRESRSHAVSAAGPGWAGRHGWPWHSPVALRCRVASVPHLSLTAPSQCRSVPLAHQLQAPAAWSPGNTGPPACETQLLPALAHLVQAPPQHQEQWCPGLLARAQRLPRGPCCSAWRRAWHCLHLLQPGPGSCPQLRQSASAAKAVPWPPHQTRPAPPHLAEAKSCLHCPARLPPCSPVAPLHLTCCPFALLQLPCYQPAPLRLPCCSAAPLHQPCCFLVSS